MTPEQFMAQLTDMVYVGHFDRGTWKQPCDTQEIVSDVTEAVRVLSTEAAHPVGTGWEQP